MTVLLIALIFGLTNAIGGRWGDIVGEDNKDGGRLLFRAIIPGVVIGLSSSSIYSGLIAWAVVTAGSILWFSPGWSFDEINGEYDPRKYPRFIQQIGIALLPVDSLLSTNRKRGIVMKGLRGLFDVGTFAGLMILSPSAILWWPATASQGVVYWACGRVSQRYAVLAAEFFYGAIRGLLIFNAIGVP